MDVWQELVISYQPLLHSLGHKYRELLEYEDLTSAGNIGLIRFAQRYVEKTEHSYAFATGARLAINSAMIDAIRQHRGRSGQKMYVLSLDIIYDAEETETWEHPVSKDDTENDALSAITSDAVRAAIATLGTAEQYIIIQRYFCGNTLDAIVASLRMPDSKVRQMHRDAMSNLRVALAGQALNPVWELERPLEPECANVLALAAAG